MSPKKPHRKGNKPTASTLSSTGGEGRVREKEPANARTEPTKTPYIRIGKKHREEEQKRARRNQKPERITPNTSQQPEQSHPQRREASKGKLHSDRAPHTKSNQKTSCGIKNSRDRGDAQRGGVNRNARGGGAHALRATETLRAKHAAPPLSAKADNAIRLAKRISDAGICSRREAETLIEEGRVEVNGKTALTPAFTVTSKDYVKIDGKLIRNTAADERLFLYHKPRGLITTTRDTHSRPTVFENLPKDLPRLISVGRLDLDSEGLLLLTTSGAIARNLELPSNHVKRTYRVRILGSLQPESIAKLARGITVDGVHYGAIAAVPERATTDGRNRWVEVTLTEGKNREIRRVFESLGHTVSRLIRTSYGPFTLGKLPRGMVMEMKHADWKKALETLLS